MTDPQTYTKDDGTVLLELSPDWRSANNGRLLVKLPIVSAHDSVVIPTAELLAMIDAADPDAMRAYLRETAPEVIVNLYRPETPEADSPEDVDEHPDRDDPTERAQIDRSWALGRAVELFSAGIGSKRAVEVADWLLGDEPEQIQDYNMAGEVVS